MIDVMIITHNEALNLPHCLKALDGWTRKVFVIDSGSTDGTQEIAEDHGAEVVFHRWEGYAPQKNWGLENLAFEAPWILIVDADEVITSELRRQLKALASKPIDQVKENGFFINRLTMFMGKPIRHCGYFPSWNMRFFKQGSGRYENREVHEHIIIDDPVGYIHEPMIHDDRRGVEHYVAKHNRYSTLEARSIFRDIHSSTEAFEEVVNIPSATRRRRWLKRYILPYLPYPSMWRFFYMYVLRLGVLDGRRGMEFCKFVSMYDYLLALKLKVVRQHVKEGRSDLYDIPSLPSGLAVPEGADPVVTPKASSSYTIGPKSSQAKGPNRIIGLSVYHGDASASGLVDGQFITGVEEERFTRIKHWAGFPANAMRHCLGEIAGGDITQVTALAVGRMPRAHFWRKMLLTGMHPRLLPQATERMRSISKVRTLEQTIADACGATVDQLPRLYRIEHHLAHIASSFFCSPYEEAMCLTIDGFGDFVSSMRAIGRGNQIDVIDRVFYPHSAGVFYTAITQYIGFPHYGDEYKMMGLAAYGEPIYADRISKLVLLQPNGLFKLDQKYFRMLREGLDMTWENSEPSMGLVYTKALEKLMGQPARRKDEELTQFHRDVAASAQRVYEQLFFHMVRSLQKSTGLDQLVLAGGCALNSLANGRLFDNTDIKDVYIQPAAGDAGTSLGAALYTHHAIMGHPREFVMQESFKGPKYETSEIRSAIAKGIPESQGQDGDYDKFTIESFDGDDVLCDQVAEGLDRGDVVGWYQGRSEWGPRALGNRSILADPRRADMRDVLNLKIKRRESFRPFAPSILEEHVDDWFTNSYPDPFMLKVYPIQPDKRALIPAVTHLDGTGRLQTVSRKANPRYHKLISAFEKRTGIPMVLNTSFNENEPIVNTPTEALNCFLRTKMDRLVMGDVSIRRKQGAL